MVGHDGTLLSDGQKQKIALTRGLVHNKPILTFHEATSNADVYSEMRINVLSQTKLKNKTVIIISHKQENILKAFRRKALGSRYRKVFHQFIIFSGDCHYPRSKGTELFVLHQEITD